MKIQLLPYSIPFSDPWHTARGVLHSRNGWLVEICTAEGMTGWGDCAPLPWMGLEKVSAAESDLQRLQRRLSGLDPQQALGQLQSIEEMSSAARFAFETALLDLLSQQQSLPLSRLLNPLAASMVEVNAAVGAITQLSDIQIMQAVDGGMKVLKLKAGVAGVEEEISRLHQLAVQLPEGARLRIDANQAWTMGDALYFFQESEKLPIESVEEPLREPDIRAWQSLAERTSIPLAADESLLTTEIEALLVSGCISRVILKPTMLGGLRRCMDLHEKAAAAGVDSVVTTTLESAVGVWACVHLAASVDTRQRFAHGLATSSWFSENIGKPPEIEGGGILLPRNSHALIQQP
ncbi:MAG: o-succinylbenzoate synthase [Gammaproteobacteria bacterium]|nr:o-succinylbenzoate synthase [Gammaproteobacteria bacterium]